jgi:hypothetical protein
MSTFYTRRNATILTIAGWVFTLAAWFTPRPWDIIAAVIAILAFITSTAIHHRVAGYAKGYADAHARAALIEEINASLASDLRAHRDLYTELNKALAADKEDA